MKVKNIAGFRTWSLKGEDPSRHDVDFLGHNHPDLQKKWGFFKVFHGQKPDIAGFLTKEVQMAEDGQAIYEFIQNAADCDATHFWLFFDDEQFLVINNGVPFTSAGMSSILNVGQSEGKMTPGKIGRFGIGFKLVHRLVGEGNGLREMLNQYAGPTMFSWSNAKQFQQFLSPNEPIEPIEPTEYNAPVAEAGTGDPWLLKILLTCFPALPAEVVRDLDYKERTVFTTEELAACRAFVAHHTSGLDHSLLTQGTMTYLRLGKGKAEKLRGEEDLLRRGVASSMHFLGRLEHIQLQDRPVARLADLHFEKFSFPLGSPERTAIPLSDPRDLVSPVDIAIGFASVDQATATLRNEPVFYKYFPAGDETAPYTLVLHSNVLSVEANRRKLQDDTTNQELLKLAANQLAIRLAERIGDTTASQLGDTDVARRIWASIVLSNPPTASHAWQKACFYDPLLETARIEVPTQTAFALPDQVKIKRTKLPVAPADFGLDDTYWFFWPHGTELAEEATKTEKIGLSVWDIEDLLPRTAQVDDIESWLATLQPEAWVTLRKELSNVALTAWQATWTRTADKTTFTLFQRFAELTLFANKQGVRKSLNQLIADPDLLLLGEVNSEDQLVLEQLGFSLFLLADQWSGNILALIQSKFTWLDPTKARLGSQELLERIKTRLPDAKLSIPQKHRLINWLAALPELGEMTLRKLALFRNRAGEVKPLDELVGPAIALPKWGSFAQLHPDDHVPALNKYLLQTKELYSTLISASWETWKLNLTPGIIANFCETVHGWYELATDKSPLPGEPGALTEQGWLSTNEVFYHAALADATKYDELATAIHSLYDWAVPVKAMLPWLDGAPFLLRPDRFSTASSDNGAVLNSIQLRELLKLATADSADLTQQFTFQAHSNDFLLTPRVDGQPIPYYTTDAALIAYLTANETDFHLLPSGKSTADLQNYVLHGSDLYKAVIENTSSDQLFEDALISVVAQSGSVTVQRLFLDRMPSLEFELATAYLPDNADRLLLQMAANPQVLTPDARAHFRSKLSLSVPNNETFSLDGAAENDEIKIPTSTDSHLVLYRTKLLPGSDERSEFVNEFANKLEADEHLRDLLGLGSSSNLPRLQDELLAELKPQGNVVQNATQLAFVLLTARHAKALGTINLVPQLSVESATGETYDLGMSWYLAPQPFIDTNYVLAIHYRNELAELLGYDKKQRRWFIEGSEFQLLHRPYVARGEFHCPGLLSEIQEINQKQLLEFLYQSWRRMGDDSDGSDWPADWSVLAGQPASATLGFIPALTVSLPDLSLLEEAVPTWVLEWASRNSPSLKERFLRAMGVSVAGSPIVTLRASFQREPAGQPHELFTHLSQATAALYQLLSNTLRWLFEQQIEIATTWHQEVLTELYKRLPPEEAPIDICTYLIDYTDGIPTYKELEGHEDDLLLDDDAYALLTEQDVPLSLLIETAKKAGRHVLDLKIYPAAWMSSLHAQPLVVETEWDRTSLQNKATEVVLPRWLDEMGIRIQSYPSALPQLRFLLQEQLDDRNEGVYWYDDDTNNIYVSALHLASLPDLLAADTETAWHTDSLELLRQELQSQREGELLVAQEKIKQLEAEIAARDAAHEFIQNLPPSDHKVRPTSVLTIEEMAQYSAEAKSAVQKQLTSKGYDCSKWHDDYTKIMGVVYQGHEVPIVVKRVGGGVLYMTPNEWNYLASSPHAQLFVFDATNKVRSVNLEAVERRNKQFFMQFDVERHIIKGVEAFAKFFQYLPYKAHFVFDVPGHSHTDDFYQSFGLWERHQPNDGEPTAQPFDSLD